jgi:hypothetical protein
MNLTIPKQIIVILVLTGFISHGAQAAPRLVESIVAKKSGVSLELRGGEEGSAFAGEAWIKSKAGRVQLKIDCATYILEGAISDDAQFVYLRYHISSGVYDEMLKRGKGGRYFRFLDSGRVANILESSKAGAKFKGFKDVECKFTGFIPPFERLSFNVIVFRGPNLGSVTLDSQSRQIVAWSRDLLAAEFVTSAGNEDSLVRTLKLHERSGKSGTALSTASSRPSEVKETLALFPSIISKLREKKRFSVTTQAGPNDQITLTGTPTQGDEASWSLEVGGEGQSFAKLSQALTAKRRLWITDSDSPENWPTPLKFFVVIPGTR